MNIRVEVSCDWQPVYKEEGIPYAFPEKISAFMNNNYRHPAIYRWNLFKESHPNEKIVYIGEAEELCPQRLNGYLNPGRSQQTNKRMKELLQKYREIGYKNSLEILSINRFFADEFELTIEDLYERHVRKLLEELIIVIYRKKEYKILNL